MIVHLIAISLSVHGLLQDPALLRPPKPIYNDVVPRTTGRNGYEEYVRAADLLRLGPAQPHYARVFGYTEPDKPQPPYLQVRRNLLVHGSAVLDLVRAGNRKPVYDPREKVGVWTLFPELSHFKNVAKLFTSESYVRYASGNPIGGTTSLLDGLTFSHNISQMTLISALVSIACNSIVLAEADARIPNMSEAEAQRVIDYVDRRLSQPDPIIRASQGERQYISSSLESMINDAKPTGADPLVEDDEFSQLVEQLKSLSPAARAALNQRVTSRLEEKFGEQMAILNQPPSKWEQNREPAHVEPPVTLEDKLVALLDPGVFSQGYIAAGKRYAQLAVFRAHAAIIRFKWQHNRLPKNLAEIGEPTYTKDPLGDGELVYELKGNWYELYSKGYKSSGPIHLKYKRPPGPWGGEGI